MTHHLSGLKPNVDPTQQPSPAGGWSEGIWHFDNALIAPGNGRGMVQEAGVYTSENDFIHEAVLWRGKALMVDRDNPPTATQSLSGAYLWGGVMLHHFGHYLTESVNRLWAYPDVKDDIDGIVFLHKRNNDLSGFNVDFMARLGVNAPIHIVKEPTHIDHLIVPGQGFGLGAISFGTQKYNDFIKSQFAPDIAPAGPEKIYASRSALSARKGGALAEKVLEDHLKREGYEVIHPQQHSLDRQIAYYKAAKHIIGLDGSALHLAGFCIAPDTKVGMVLRRSSGVAVNIQNQLHGFTGRRPAMIDAISHDWVLANRGKADRFSIGQIDMTELGGKLHAAGLLEADPNWPALDDAVVEAEIAELSKVTKLKYEKRLGRRRLHDIRMARRARREGATE